MSEHEKDLDPQDVIEQPNYVRPDEDPTGPEVTDPNDPNYVEPAVGVSKPKEII